MIVDGMDQCRQASLADLPLCTHHQLCRRLGLHNRWRGETMKVGASAKVYRRGTNMVAKIRVLAWNIEGQTYMEGSARDAAGGTRRPPPVGRGATGIR